MREITLQDACRNKTENHDDIQTDPTQLKQLDETLKQTNFLKSDQLVSTFFRTPHNINLCENTIWV